MLSLKRQSIVPRIDGIQRDVKRLKKLCELSPKAFGEEDNFSLAQFYLRRALEGVFHIGSHILSRLEGGRPTQYKDIARLLGEKGIVEGTFATGELTKMAGYRNRLTHFYADVTPRELYEVLREDIDDFNVFLHAIKKVVEHPERFNLTVE